MDFRDTKAIYLQIADRICDEVLVGKFAEDSRIPLPKTAAFPRCASMPPWWR